MGDVRERIEAGTPVLVREAELPTPSAIGRPCSIAGMAVALVFLAAMLDAALWQTSYDRQELEGQVGAAELKIEMLESENRAMRLELLKRDLQELEAMSQRSRTLWKMKLIADHDDVAAAIESADADDADAAP